MPSRLALTQALEAGRKPTAVTGAVCSLNVTKQKPLSIAHNFTCGHTDIQ